jgi:hypothetical protein
MYNNLLSQYINATYYINFNKSPKYPYVLLNDTNNDFNISPLDQFEIKNFISLDLSLINNIQLSLTNIGLYLTISAFIIVTLNSIAINYDKLVSNN